MSIVASVRVRRGALLSGRTRLIVSLIASALLNIVVWAGAAHLALHAHFSGEQARERLVSSASSIQIERRSVRRPRHANSARPPQRAVAETPSLSAPSGWTKQDIGHEGMLDASLWLDLKDQSAEFVPRVFRWQKQNDTADARNPSLNDAVVEIVAVLRDEGAKLYASGPLRLCRGTRPGWFLSYDKPEEDPPVHIDDALLVAGGTIFRATYVRPVGQVEDLKARAALKSLC